MSAQYPGSGPHPDPADACHAAPARPVSDPARAQVPQVTLFSIGSRSSVRGTIDLGPPATEGCGLWRSLVAHITGGDGVAGSILSTPKVTQFHHAYRLGLLFPVGLVNYRPSKTFSAPYPPPTSPRPVPTPPGNHI